jgi:hypothetical protein
MSISSMKDQRFMGCIVAQHCLDASIRQAEVEVKAEQRPDVLHLSLNLSLDLSLFRVGGRFASCLSSRDSQRVYILAACYGV